MTIENTTDSRRSSPTSGSGGPPDALVREVASWLYAIAPKPPGPSSPPLYSPVRTGPLWEADRREYEAKARQCLAADVLIEALKGIAWTAGSQTDDLRPILEGIRMRAEMALEELSLPNREICDKRL